MSRPEQFMRFTNALSEIRSEGACIRLVTSTGDGYWIVWVNSTSVNIILVGRGRKNLRGRLTYFVLEGVHACPFYGKPYIFGRFGPAADITCARVGVSEGKLFFEGDIATRYIIPKHTCGSATCAGVRVTAGINGCTFTVTNYMAATPAYLPRFIYSHLVAVILGLRATDMGDLAGTVIAYWLAHEYLVSFFYVDAAPGEYIHTRDVSGQSC